eukprot:9479992-Pyramimonas_sp.AAC.1
MHSCSCHPPRTLRKLGGSALDEQGPEGGGSMRCPLRGRRGPELANGHWLRFLDRAIDQKEGDMISMTAG